MSSYISNSFSVSVNRPTTGTIEPVSTVNIYKNEKTNFKNSLYIIMLHFSLYSCDTK